MVTRLLLVVFLTAVTADARTRSVRSGDPGPATWFRDHAIALSSLDTDELRPLLPLVGNARLVALGDATHGTHEFFAFKGALIQLLIEEAGFRTIIFEGPYAEFEKLDEFVQTGVGDPGALLESNDYFFWDTQETLDLILWIRARNASGIQPPIRIAGADSAHPATAAEIVLEFLRREDPLLAQDAELRYSCLTLYGPNRLNYRDDGFCRRSVLSVRPLLAEKFPGHEEILHAARVVEQGEEAFATQLANRDAAMAENIEWLMSRRSGEKMIVWGHNEHFGETDYTLVDPTVVRSTGSLLSALYGDDYYSIGSMAFEGTFNASEYVPLARAAFVTTQTMTVASDDDYARLFRQSGLPMLLVSLRQKLPQWLAQPHRMRFAGSGVLSRDRATLDTVQNLSEKFDAMFYVETSTPSLLRHRPSF